MMEQANGKTAEVCQKELAGDGLGRTRRPLGENESPSEADAAYNSAVGTTRRPSGPPPPLPARGMDTKRGQVPDSAATMTSRQLPETLALDIFLHGESFPMVVTGAETVGWLQSEASAAFSRAHVSASHQIQVIGLYATVKSGEARPLDAASDALACAAQFLPPGSAGPVRLQGRLMVKVCIDPNGPVGIVLDSKAKDCAIVKALVAAPPDSAQRSSAQRSMSLAPATKKKFMSRFTGGAGGGKDDWAAEKAAAAALAQPLLGSDAVEEGMLVSRVEAHLGAGRTLEHDTSSLSAAETRSLLRPLQHLRRAVTFVDPPPEGAAADAAEDGRQVLYTVNIEVVRAENLRVADVFSSDPYCQLRLAGMSRRTAVRKTTTSPAWHETFVFPLLSLEWELLCELWDENFGKDDSLGEVRIDMRTLPVNRAPTSTSSAGPGGKGPPPLPPRERIEWHPVENGKGRLKLRIHIQENVSLQVVPIKPIWPKSAPESSPVSLEDIFLQPAAAPTTSTKGKKSGATSATSPSATSTDPPTSLLYPGTVAFLKRFGGGSGRSTNGSGGGSSGGGSSGGGGSVTGIGSIEADVTRDLTQAYKAAGGASPAVEASRHFRQLRYPSEWNAAGSGAGQGAEGYAPAKVEIRGGRTEELPTALGSLSVGAAAVPRDAYDIVGGNAPPPLLCAPPLVPLPGAQAARGARPQAVPFSTAALTLVMEGAANASHRLCPGDAYSYWRWAAALAFACSGVEPPLAAQGGTGTALQGTVLDVRPSGKATSAGTAECAIEDGVVRWQREGRTTGGGVGQAELADITAVELTHDHMRAKRYVFNITVVTGQDLVVGGIHSSPQRASITGGGTALKPYCRVAVGSDARCTRAYTMEARAISWNRHFSFAVTAEEARSGGCRLEVLHARRAHRDKMLGDAFVPFSSLEPGQEYTETVKLSERFRHLRLALVCATGLPRADRHGLSDPFCVIAPIRSDGTVAEGETATSAVISKTLDPHWDEAFTFGVRTAAEELQGLRLTVYDHDHVTSHDVLGEAMISITEFEERPGVPLEIPLRVCAGVDVAKLKKLGLKEVKDGSGGAALALGTVTVILSETDATESVLKRKPSSPAAATAQATVTVRCTLREADELSAAWPVKLLEHQPGELCTELPPVDARGISCYSMVVGLNALNLARIAQEDERPAEKAIAGAAVDTSPFCKGLLPSRAGDVGSSGAGEPLSFDISEMRVEVWENQRKQPLLGWGSGKRRHLTPGDPRRYTDASGGSRIKALAMLAAPPGYMYSGDWVEGKWQYGTDSFAELAKDIAKGASCPEKRGSHVRRRMWRRQLLPAPGSPVASSPRGASRRNQLTASPPRMGSFSGEDSSDDEGWGGAIGSGGGGSEPAVKIGLNDVLRLVAISPSTLAIEVLLRKTAFGSPAVSSNGNSSATAAGSRVATIVVGPCWADRLGSLVMERRSMCCAREALTSVLTHIGSYQGPTQPPEDSSDAQAVYLQWRGTVVAEAVTLLEALLSGMSQLETALAAANAAAERSGSDGGPAEALTRAIRARLIRFHAYLRELIGIMSDRYRGASALQLCQFVATSNWNNVAEAVAAEVRDERDREELPPPPAAGMKPAPPLSAVAQSLAAVRRIVAVASGFAMELLLGAAAATEEQVRVGLGVMATHCYARSIDELGKHMATKNQGMSPLSAESLLDLLSFLLRRDDCLTAPPATTSSTSLTSTQHQPAGLEAVLVAMHWRVTPSPLLSSFLPPRAVAEAYAIKAEDKLRAFFENIVANSSRPLPAEVGFDVEVWEYLDRGDNPKVMSVVAATAMQLLCEGHMAIIQKRFPTHGEVQGALLRAAAGALATLRNAVAARAHSVFEALLLTAADNHGTNAVVRHHLSVFLCAMANDARWLVQESLPDLEEGCELGAQAEDGRAAQALSVVTQVWLDLCAECTQRLARLVLVTLEQQVNFNGLCHVEGSAQLVHARRVLKEQFGGLRDLLDEWCYNRLLARIADHIVVRIVEDLVHRAVVGERLQDGDILRLKEVQTAAARTLQDIAGEGAGSDLYEQRMEFLDEAVRLLSATPDELETLTRNLIAHHSSCQLSIQHMLEIIVQLRPDGHTDAIPEEVIKWADPDNHMGVDSEGDNQGSGLRDYSELSPHSRLFRQPLAALRAMHTELGVMLQATTAMADPRTGQRVMPKAQEKPQETSLMRRFTLTGKSNIPSKLESPPPSTRRRKAFKSPPHALSTEGPGATSVELHIRVTEADGLAMTATVGRSKYRCMVDIKSTEGAQHRHTHSKKAAAGSGNPVWDEVLIFKMRSLVGTLLELTIITESRSKGETTLGGLKIPLSGCAVLKELSVDTFLRGDERRRLSTSGGGSGNDDEGDSGDIKGSWFPLDPPGAGRVRLRLQAMEIGDVIMI